MARRAGNFGLEIEMVNMNFVHVTGAVAGLTLLAGAWAQTQSPPTAWTSSELIGMKVVSEKGDDLGKIEDVVVRPKGDASYAVLSFGGTLGVGDKLFAMPWSVLRTVEADTAKKDSARSLVLPLAKERFKTAPGFDKNAWPEIANREWTKDIDAFYAGDFNPNTKRPVESAMKGPAVTWRVTELDGMNVETPTGDKLGELGELVIDTNGRVSYATISVGGFLGMGEKHVPVPWDLLKFSVGGDKADTKLITLATTKEQLEKAPEFKSGKEHRAEMCSQKWMARVYEHFSCPVYWSVTDAPKAKPISQN